MSPAPIRPATAGVPLTSLTALLGVPEPADDVVVTGVSLDSRTVLPGDLYAALPGFNVHGARFAETAVASGAVAVLTDVEGASLMHADGPVGVPVLVVDRARDVLGGVASRVYGEPSARLTLIGATGTNGKTTTAYLVESALRAAGHRTGLVGTVETRIADERIESVRTTPEATDLHAMLAVMLERRVDTCVMEVSSHALSQHRVDGVVYDVALFTNLSQDHLDFHPTMEDYFQVKASLFTPERSRAGIVCVDDEWGRRLAAMASVPVVTVSTHGAPADWSVVVDPHRQSTFTLSEASTGRALHLVSQLPGTFNVANTALAALALLSVGLAPADVERAMLAPADVPGRMEVVSAGGAGAPRCIVDFAHTPDAIDAALAALRPSTSGRLIAVVGAGGDRDRGKRPAMGAAAARHADVVVVTDDNPRSEAPETIRAEVLEGAHRLVEVGGAVATQVLDGGARAQAIAEAIALSVLGGREGHSGTDTVVVLGKGHEKGQEISGVKHPFDDRDEVRKALRAATGEAVPS